MGLRGNKDRKYLSLCVAGAGIFSTCGKRQYMAIVTGRDGRVCGTGYNGSPPGVAHCIDGACPRWQQNSAPGSNYDNCIAIHAEQNALMWSDRGERDGGTIYVNGPPCMTCARLICGSGLKRLVHITDDSYADWPQVRAFILGSGIEVTGVERNDLQDSLDRITI